MPKIGFQCGPLGECLDPPLRVFLILPEGLPKCVFASRMISDIRNLTNRKSLR